MTQNQINKRSEIIKGIFEDLMAGHDVVNCARSPLSFEDAELKLNSLLSDPKIVKTINAMAIAWAR